MKKTLVAAAIAAAVAAPVAMADVKISGQVKYWVVNSGNGGNDMAPSHDNSVTFSSSEDLGNGLTAFGSLTVDMDNNDNNTLSGEPNKDMKLGLKGAWGTVVAGQMEYLTEGVVSSMMDDGLSSHGENAQLESALTAFGRDNAIAYVSPTYNGFHFAVAGSNAADQHTFTNTDIAAIYENGPLTVKASRANVEGTSSATTSGNYDVTAIGASYKIADAKISAMVVDKDFTDTGTDLKDKIVRLDYTFMGNNVLTLGKKSVDNESASRTDVTTYKLTHKFSKQTAAFVGHRSKGNGVANVDFIGMVHKF